MAQFSQQEQNAMRREAARRAREAGVFRQTAGILSLCGLSAGGAAAGKNTVAEDWYAAAGKSGTVSPHGALVRTGR